MAQPDFIPSPFAANGDRNTLPESSVSAASWDDGFPAVTAMPLGAGGVAPDRKDFNAILYVLSLFAYFAQTGGLWTYSATQEYTPPALIYDATDGNLYVCVAANGPSGTTIAPNADTTGQYWKKLPLEGVSWLNAPVPTRASDNTFTVTGDQTAAYPMGKLLRFNGDDAYICRVLGAPVYGSNLTTVTVWFDVATTIPASITQFEVSPLSPIDTARGVELITSTQYDEDQITELLQSHCYSAITIEKAGSA